MEKLKSEIYIEIIKKKKKTIIRIKEFLYETIKIHFDSKLSAVILSINFYFPFLFFQ